MENKINIDINRTVTRIGGNKYGSEIFVNQVVEKLDEDSINIIIFPDVIRTVNVSFVKGFLEEFSKRFARTNFERMIRVEGSEKFVELFYKALRY